MHLLSLVVDLFVLVLGAGYPESVVSKVFQNSAVRKWHFIYILYIGFAFIFLTYLQWYVTVFFILKNKFANYIFGQSDVRNL